MPNIFSGLKEFNILFVYSYYLLDGLESIRIEFCMIFDCCWLLSSMVAEKQKSLKPHFVQGFESLEKEIQSFAIFGMHKDMNKFPCS